MNHEENLKIAQAASDGPWIASVDYDAEYTGVGKKVAWTCLGICDAVDNGEDFDARVANSAFIAHTKEPDQGYEAYVKRVMELEGGLRIVLHQLDGAIEYLADELPEEMTEVDKLVRPIKELLE